MSGMAEGPGVAPEPGRREIGGPEGGLEGRAPEGTAGPSPAAGEAATRTAQRFRYTTEYRRTRMGAITDSIAICETCRRVVEPVSRTRSRTGRHGEDHYEHEHPLTIVVLLQSNAGNRSHHFVGEKATDEAVRSVIEMAIDAWEWYRVDFDDIYKKAKALLRNLPRG
jgi:hypothetical protein